MKTKLLRKLRRDFRVTIASDRSLVVVSDAAKYAHSFGTTFSLANWVATQYLSYSAAMKHAKRAKDRAARRKYYRLQQLLKT